MLISTWSDKGGTGKTTLAILAGLHLDAQLLDLDPQGDLLRWAEKANRPCSKVLNEATLIAAAKGSPITVVDCPPGRHPSSLQGMAFSQIVVIPTRSGDADLVALARALDAVASVKANGNPRLVPAVVLNAIRDTSRAHGIAKALAVPSNYTYIGELKERVAYEESYSEGTSVLDAPNTLAATEAKALLARLDRIIAGLQGKRAGRRK